MSIALLKLRSICYWSESLDRYTLNYIKGNIPVNWRILYICTLQQDHKLILQLHLHQYYIFLSYPVVTAEATILDGKGDSWVLQCIYGDICELLFCPFTCQDHRYTYWPYCHNSLETVFLLFLSDAVPSKLTQIGIAMGCCAFCGEHRLTPCPSP